MDSPAPDMYSECWTCGSKNVRTLSMADMLAVPGYRVVDAHTFMRPGVAWGYLQCDHCEDKQASERTATRKQKWARFFETRARWQKSCASAAPAFVQEIVIGLWSVQELSRRPLWEPSWLYQTLRDPPSHDPSEPYYDGWPGDHRGWMRFESKEAARDFYKFSTGRITWEVFQSLPRTPLSNVRIDLDANGDFVEPKADKAVEAPQAE